MVTVAVSAFSLFALAALAIDMGKFYVIRTQLQNAGDAGALAGAYTLTQPYMPQPSGAQAAAVAIANQNKTLQGQVSISTSDVTYDATKSTVTVKARLTGGNSVVFNLAKVVGVNALSMSATAVAHASTAAGGGTNCLKPFFIANTSIAPTGASNPCGNNQTIVYPLNNAQAGQLTPYAQTVFNSPSGYPVIMKYQGKGGPAPSQFGLLALAGNGASTLSCTITSCISQCGGQTAAFHCGDQMPLMTGNKVGPTHSGVDALIGNPPNDTWVGPGQYLNGSTGTKSNQSNQLVTVAVWDDCTQTISPGHSGANPTIAGFMQVFITGFDSNDNLSGYMVAPGACTDAGGSGFGTGFGAGSNASGGTTAVAVQLVK